MKYNVIGIDKITSQNEYHLIFNIMNGLIWEWYVSFMIWWSRISLNSISDYSLEYYKLYSNARDLLHTIDWYQGELSKYELRILIGNLGDMIRTMTKYRKDLKKGIDRVPKEYKL